MKKVIILFVFIGFVIEFYGQTSIKIYTKLPDAKFKIIYDDEVENTIPTKEVFFDSVDYKKTHKVVIMFAADTVADINEKIYLFKNQAKVFEILEKPKGMRKVAKFNRGVGKDLNVGEHNDDLILYDVYYLEDHTKY